MAILKLNPSHKNYLWGGNKLKSDFNKEFDGEVLAESWELSCHVDEDSFLHMLILEGSGKITNSEEVEFAKGDSILLTASTGDFVMTGRCEALLTTIPFAET